MKSRTISKIIRMTPEESGDWNTAPKNGKDRDGDPDRRSE